MVPYPNPLLMAGISAGGNFLTNLFQGKSELDKQQEEFGKIRLQLIDRLKDSYANSMRFGATDNLEDDMEMANVDYLNRLAKSLGPAGGMRSGQGIGEMLRAGQSGLTKQLLPYKMEAPFKYAELMGMLAR